MYGTAHPETDASSTRAPSKPQDRWTRRPSPSLSDPKVRLTIRRSLHDGRPTRSLRMFRLFIGRLLAHDIFRHGLRRLLRSPGPPEPRETEQADRRPDE